VNLYCVEKQYFGVGEIYEHCKMIELWLIFALMFLFLFLFSSTIARSYKIVGIEIRSFINQQVDFYLPQAKLVIEIDGQQHKKDEVTRVSDATRDNYLLSYAPKSILYRTFHILFPYFILIITLKV